MEIWSQCLITGKKFTSYRGFCNHLRGLKITSKQYFDMFYKTGDMGFCKTCGGETTYHANKYMKFCSDVCANKSPERILAVSNRFKGEDREDKLKRFAIARGNVNSNPEKRKLTMTAKAEKLGISLFEYMSRIAKASAASTSAEDKRAQTVKSMQTKAENGYGETCIKGNSYKVVNINGLEIKCQGYEPPVIKFLVEKYQDKFRFGKSAGFIDYFCSSTNKNRMYFPDATSDNVIIEVKSKYTYESNKQTTLDKLKYSYLSKGKCLLILPSRKSTNLTELSDGFKKLLDWVISSQASKNGIYILEEGSTTILYGVGSSDPKCLESTQVDCDIVWSSVKAEVVLEANENRGETNESP